MCLRGRVCNTQAHNTTASRMGQDKEKQSRARRGEEDRGEKRMPPALDTTTPMGYLAHKFLQEDHYKRLIIHRRSTRRYMPSTKEPNNRPM